MEREFGGQAKTDNAEVIVGTPRVRRFPGGHRG